MLSTPHSMANYHASRRHVAALAGNLAAVNRLSSKGGSTGGSGPPSMASGLAAQLLILRSLFHSVEYSKYWEHR